jgi:hypothetical protein
MHSQTAALFDAHTDHFHFSVLCCMLCDFDKVIRLTNDTLQVGVCTEESSLLLSGLLTHSHQIAAAVQSCKHFLVSFHAQHVRHRLEVHMMIARKGHEQAGNHSDAREADEQRHREQQAGRD